MNLTNYIVSHDIISYDYFYKNNGEYIGKVENILVGTRQKYSLMDERNFLGAAAMHINIEHYPSLLTFTAWYLLAKNDICETDFIGIFEYDVKFLSLPEIELKEDTIYGFIQRPLPDPNGLYLDATPQFRNLLPKDKIQIAQNQPYWNATSNFIVHKNFLIKFVDWYMGFIPNILQYYNHAHYHERAINYFAANEGYKNETLPILQHAQLNSHNIQL